MNPSQPLDHLIYCILLLSVSKPTQVSEGLLKYQYRFVFSFESNFTENNPTNPLNMEYPLASFFLVMTTFRKQC